MAATHNCQIDAECPEAVADVKSSAGNKPARPLRVLLAEDTRAVQKLVRFMLEKRGHAVEIVENGREAVTLVSHRQFDVVLMDVQMPLMNGLEAVAAIRRLPDEATARLPAIALTIDGEGCGRQQCLDAGMDAYLRKPIVCGELIKMVEEIAEHGKPLDC